MSFLSFDDPWMTRRRSLSGAPTAKSQQTGNWLLERQLDPELQESRWHDGLGTCPCRAVGAVRSIHSQHVVRIEHVVQIEHALQSDGLQRDSLRDAEIELVCASRIER